MVIEPTTYTARSLILSYSTKLRRSRFRRPSTQYYQFFVLLRRFSQRHADLFHSWLMLYYIYFSEWLRRSNSQAIYAVDLKGCINQLISVVCMSLRQVTDNGNECFAKCHAFITQERICVVVRVTVIAVFWEISI